MEVFESSLDSLCKPRKCGGKGAAGTLQPQTANCPHAVGQITYGPAECSNVGNKAPAMPLLHDMKRSE